MILDQFSFVADTILIMKGPYLTSMTHMIAESQRNHYIWTLYVGIDIFF